MQRVVFLNRYFFPDHSATSQLLGDLAFHVAQSGREVHVVTSRQRYDDPEAALPPEETVRGVHVHRVATTRFGRAGLGGRGIDYLSFYASARRTLDVLLRRGDIVVAMTDPPLAALIALPFVRSRGVTLVNWLQDIYPEIAVRLGVPGLGLAAGALAARRNRGLAAATMTVVVGERMASFVNGLGVEPGHVRVIPNWPDAAIVPVARADNPLRAALGLGDAFVVGYSGNLGRAHEFETLLGAARSLMGKPDLVFLCIGGGRGFDALAARVKERGLGALFRFVPYQERAALSFSLGAADVHWLSLRPELEGLVVPSKVYGIAAAGRPILAIAASDGEVGRLVTAHDCGIVIAPGDTATLTAAIHSLAADPKRGERLGQNARAMLDRHFTRERALASWQETLAALDR